MKTFLIPLAAGLVFAGNVYAQSAETIGNSPAPAFIGALDAAATPPQPIEVADAPAVSVSTLNRDGLLLLGLLLAIGGAVMVVRRS